MAASRSYSARGAATRRFHRDDLGELEAAIAALEAHPA
jgi:hypothetical protein